MTNESPLINRLKWWILLVAVPILAGAAQIDLPALWNGFIGDSAVYYAMADSLARDGDLRYTRNDLQRITAEWPDGPQGILLTADPENPEVIHYAKPMLYSLAAAPLVRIFHANGLLIFNTLCFACLLFMGCLAYPEWETRRPVEITVWTLIFWGLTAVPAYIFNLTPDLFNGTLLMAGLVVWVRHEFHPRPRRILLLSALILGIAAAARPPNGLFLVLPLWSLFFGTSPLRLPRLPMRLGTAIAVVILFAAGIGCILLISRGMTGESFAYSGFRKRIVGHFPFESELYTFLNTGNAMSTQTTKFIFHWDTLGHNLRYFFVGRFAGLVPYFFPAFVALVAMLPVGGRHRVRTPVLLVIIGLFLFHLIYIPSNWHGGSCAVGNRYLISWLPAFFILIRQPPNRKLLLVTAGLTALFSGAIALSPATAFVNYRDIPKRPVMQAFPMEITLLESWPVDDLSHRRVDYGDYFIYFADDNQFGSENDGFWVKGRRRADMVIRCWKPVDTVTLTIRNGSRPARIYGSAGDADFRKTVGGGETFQIRLNPGTPVNAYNLAGNVSYCYPVRIGTSSGFIPRFTESGSTDHRFLGCFVRIGLDP